jgi:hypothetical protein
MLTYAVHLILLTGVSGSHGNRDQSGRYRSRKRLTRDEAGNIIDPQVVRQRSLDDARHVAAEK